MQDIVFWLFYIPLTAFAVLALIIVPTSMLQNSVQPITMDAAIMQDRLFMKSSEFSPIFGQTNKLTGNLNKSVALELSEKKFAYNVSAGSQSVYGNKEFYEDAVPIASIKYDRFTSSRTLMSSSGPVVVTVDQIYPKSYEKIK